MADLGDFPVSHTAVCIPFDSFAAATGAPSAVTNFASSDIQIYKNGGTTQRSSANGITVTTSFDTSTGLQMIVIDLSDNTDAGFYAAGNEYQVAVADITVDGQTLRFWAGTFSIERAGGILALLKATGTIKVDVNKWLSTTVSTPTVAGVPNVNAKTWNDLSTVALPLVPTTAGRTLDVSAGGEAGLDWANVGSPTTTLGLTGTTIATTQKVDVETIKTNPVVNGGTITFPTTATLASTTNLTAGTIATVSGNVNGSVGSVTGAVGSVTGNVGGNVTGSIGSVATGGIAAASFAANAIDNTAIATDAIGSAELAASAVTEIQTAILSDATPFAGASIAAIKAKTDNLPESVKKNTALANFEFLMIDSADHVTGKTGLTVAGAVSIDGGGFGALTNTPATEVANGIYKIDLAAADLNGNFVTLKFTAASCDARFIHIKTTT